MDGDAWPMLGEHTPAIGIDFAEGDGSHSGSFEPKAESANSGEEVEDIHRRSGGPLNGLRHPEALEPNMGRFEVLRDPIKCFRAIR